jgi:arylsulfatase A-like enzyme
MPRRFVAYALQWMAEQRGRPFFVYIAQRDPHAPNFGTYADAVTRLDASVGQLLADLDELGVGRNTLVFFTSDNGPAKGGGSAGAFVGGKGSCAEGGVRMPAAARWPARIPAGGTVREVTSTLDLFPTFVALARGSVPARFYPGEDVTRLLTGQLSRLAGRGVDGGREVVFWQERGAVGGLRSGRLKFLEPGMWNTAKTLVDLEADPGETRDLCRELPELCEQLEQRLFDLVSQGGR